ncbi:MAG: hypothetical protein EXR56_04010 [Chloroflexi bacterium]|nr:hypothetical protein [Chloroflexota bacterium]
MAYSYKNSRGVEYYLHGRTRTVANGKQVTLHFFAKTEREGGVEALPVGYTVIESAKTGLPILKKKA